nr:putative ribonuclease H-like domain-containing protein [Tanacetum cinerariifolium]
MSPKTVDHTFVRDSTMLIQKADSDYQEYDGGFVAFAGSSKGGKITGNGLEWLFDIDSITNLMNYQPISVGNRTNGIAGLKIHSNVGQEGKEKVSDQEYILLLVLNTSSDVPSSNEEVESSPKDNADMKSIVKPTCVERGKINNLGCLNQQMKSTVDSENTNSTNSFNTASDKDGTFQRTYGEWNFSTPIQVNVAGSSFSHPSALDDFSKMPNLEDTGIFDDAYDDRDEGAEANYNNLETGHRQEKGIDYDEVFALVARIEAIRLFLAYASFMDFTVYQMDVKSTLLYGTIKEEVYVSQPLSFVDPQFLDKVYKVEKVLYGLHQAPRAWYETLSNYLLENGFRRRTTDKTLFIKKIKNDILLV